MYSSPILQPLVVGTAAVVWFARAVGMGRAPRASSWSYSASTLALVVTHCATSEPQALLSISQKSLVAVAPIQRTGRSLWTIGAARSLTWATRRSGTMLGTF